MSLEPDQVERLRKKLYEKAKREPDFRFYSLYDKVCWIETLERAYRQAKANAGAAGVDGVRFEDIEAYGVEQWLAELRNIPLAPIRVRIYSAVVAGARCHSASLFARFTRNNRRHR